MKKIDCCGEYCPIPLLKIKKELDGLKVNEPLMMVTDHSCVVESINDYFKQRAFNFKIEEVINGVWEITIMKKNN